MKSWKQRLYEQSPWAIKRYLVEAEARRRNRYRRYGDYSAVRHNYSLQSYMDLSLAEQLELQRERLTELLIQARAQSGFYRERIPESGDALDVLRQVPVLTKAEVRQHMDAILDPEYERAHVWRGVTSGSTGTPLRFPVGREGIRARTAIQDNYYEMNGCHYGDRRVRLGGSQIVPVRITKPPYWIYSKPDNQLLMSAYHIERSTLPEYVAKIDEFRPTYVTGYGHAQYLVAQYLCSVGGLKNPPKVTFTDSEGLLPEQHAVIEEGFGAPSYDAYGLGEVGWVAVQCRRYRHHILGLSCILEVVDDDGKVLPPGELGRLVVTDLTQTAFPYIRYDTGDAGILSKNRCSCGMESAVLECIEGRSDDLIVTPRGRKLGRVSRVTWPGRGILESQIAQTRPDHVVIRIVPTSDFDRESMRDVVQVAHDLLGEDMRVDWEIVDEIPRTRLHKFKNVVREFSH